MGKFIITIVFSLFLWINECSVINHQNWGYGSELDFRITNLNLSVYPMFHEIVREKYGKVITNYNLLLLFQISDGPTNPQHNYFSNTKIKYQ